MKSLNDIRKVYFLGIGGIGMSAIARYCLAKGMEVYGYDRTRTVLTEALESEGMKIHYTESPELIPSGIELVIYTPAVPADHKELIYFREHRYTVIKRSEALGMLSAESKSIAIAGTHGKTTTSTLTAHVLKQGGIDISAFLGGIAVDYHSNYLTGRSEWMVLEADEYDRSFLRLSPYFAAILSMDPDHLDIYGDSNQVYEGYREFASKVRDGGYLLLKSDLIRYFSEQELADLTARGITVKTFGYSDADILIADIRVEQGKYVFDYLQSDGKSLAGVVLNLPGRHNVENATVAINIALRCGVSEENIRKALAEFRGIQRRFEKIIEAPDFVYIDDYAHHPTELKAAIDAARTLYPGKKVTGIFQPHLYTRTRDFADGFAKALNRLDEIILMDIYPARELPIEGVNSEMIFEKLKNKNKKLVSKATLMDALKEIKTDVLLTLGAGDIDTFVPKIKEKWTNGW
ncbi:MAG: UDP-N-acetylmuramate--L-alanine ligase [Saprospiraceae bacterium]|nr:UDP-N-acetylmuramate--L-alanine ligase [Saprospiraceae bacterium]